MKPFYVIKARLWFEKTSGNTYHSCEVIKNNKSLIREPFIYGYGSAYEQTALELLEQIGEIKKGQFSNLWQWQEHIGRETVYMDIMTVSRKKDL